MWVRFKAPFDWTPPSRRRVTMAYPAGFRGSVTHDCAAAAIAAGAADEIDPPPRDEREATQRETAKPKRPGGEAGARGSSASGDECVGRVQRRKLPR